MTKASSKLIYTGIENAFDYSYTAMPAVKLKSILIWPLSAAA